LRPSFGLIEWLRNWLLTGFPWNMAGQTWAAGGAMSQSAAIFGALGLTVMTLLIVGVARGAGGRGLAPGQAGHGARRGLALAGLWGWGAWRLSSAEVRDRHAGAHRPGRHPQKEKWREGALPGIVDAHVRLSRAPGGEAADVIIWPEGALPASLEYLFDPASPGAELGRRVPGALQPGQHLFMGVSRAGEGGAHYFNSLAFLQREAGGLRVNGFYDKHHLLPFGEYLPFGPLMTRLGVRSLVNMPSDYAAGAKPRTVLLPGLPRVQPLICYESIFPGAMPSGGPRPAWIVLPANEAGTAPTADPGST
jgi:apolipoprotein N-acyltransferase